MMEKRTFDVCNCIVMGGVVHALTTKAVACPEYPSHNPCEMCSLREYCDYSFKELCDIFSASSEEFFYSVGVLKGVDQHTCIIRADENWLLEYSSSIDFELRATEHSTPSSTTTNDDSRDVG